MAPSIFDYPPEVLIHILNLLPVHALLKFGETSHYSRALANSSLHTLSLGVHASRVSNIISQLAETQVSVLIPDAQSYDYPTLLSFHTSLTKSILTRHGGTLRNLDLSLWTLTIPTAKVISSLSALRALSIRIEDFPHVRTVPRSGMAVQRAEQRAAWDILASTATFASRLHALRIEGGEVRTTQLAQLLSQSRWCSELWLCKCIPIGEELWSWLGSEWQGGPALRILGVMRCGGQLGQNAFDAIGALRNLQFLSLQGSYGIDSGSIEKINKEKWHIREVIPPLTPLEEQDGEMIIEVDPAYM
ncbi:hypothetical protein P280DRAFT_394118 [Massarina eburnea CBS 473.64]|uniref:F-box domain-containing protein n=1 Tax=Massarina eburnea CBS 473.64 TaxID=1395130 RepID=A0A6A6S6J9_9PLEO|nr:hypothetical protein P280DRAFT_394118 [Massarina eburnea CBS 473.64]